MRDMMLTTSALKVTVVLTLLLQEALLVCLQLQHGLSLALVTLTARRLAVAVAVGSTHRYKMHACSLTA
jgi:hypothetical protein